MRFAFWKRRKQERKLSMSDVLEKLSLIKARLSRRVKEVEVKHRELFEQVVKAHLEKDEEKAAMYAEELAELRKIHRRITHASLLLEGVIYRIEAVKDLSSASKIIIPLKDVLAVASQEVRGVAPAASNGLVELMDMIEDLSVNMGGVPETAGMSPQLSEEARKILEEAGTIAAQRGRREKP